MATQQKALNHASHVHFTFGNEKWAVKSSYQCDFSCAQGFPTSRMKKHTPPESAEVIPHVNRALEKGKWASSTMRDFTGFGEDSRRRAYETSQRALKNTKALHNRDLGLLQEDARVPPLVSRYHIDFCSHNTAAQAPRCAQWNQTDAESGRRCDQFISEARHAFQWPSSDRLKLPPHFRSASSHS